MREDQCTQWVPKKGDKVEFQSNGKTMTGIIISKGKVGEFYIVLTGFAGRYLLTQEEMRKVEE